MARKRDVPTTQGRGPHGAATGYAARYERAARDRQTHVESGHDAADHVLEVPQAQALRTRSLRAVRPRHPRRVRMPAVRGPRHLRCGALLLWRLVRGLISSKYQFREPSKKRFIVPPRRFLSTGQPVGRNPPTMKPKRPRISGRKTYFLVLWWMSQTPYAAIFENQVAAEAAANVRNALMVTISGRDVKVDQVQDWYRRDESGAPMPAEWRDLVGQIHVPWLAKPKPSL